jgi:hypothetical protein
LGASVAPEELVRDVERARMVDVHYELVGDRTIGPALRFVRDRLEGEGRTLPWTFRSALRVMLSQVDLLWRRGLLEYVLLRAEKGS